MHIFNHSRVLGFQQKAIVRQQSNNTNEILQKSRGSSVKGPHSSGSHDSAAAISKVWGAQMHNLNTSAGDPPNALWCVPALQSGADSSAHGSSHHKPQPETLPLYQANSA